MIDELKKKESSDYLILKNHCATRWCADAHAVKAFRKKYTIILSILTKLSADDNENSSTRSEAEVLNKKLQKFETALNIVVWDTLLQKLHETSIELQKSTINLTRVVPPYQSLIDF